MRLGISSSLNEPDAGKWAERMSKMGCKSVVFPLDCSAGKDRVKEFTKAAKENDLLIAEVGIWRNVLASSKEERKTNFEYAVGQLRLADEIGAKCCVNVAGAFGDRWDGGHRANFTKEAWNETVQSVRAIIDEVKPKNTKFAIESMPWMYPTGPEEYKRLMEDVEREEFAAHLDVINMVNCPKRYFFFDEFLEECFDILGESIVSCHLKNSLLLEGYTFQLKECALEEGRLNVTKYVELAHKLDKDMPMIIEHLADDEAYAVSMKYALEKFENYL